MRILGVTETCDLGSLYQRLIADGHEVRVSVSHPLAAGTMQGLVPRCDDWRAQLSWIKEAGTDGIILFEAVGLGALQDKLRAEGYHVIGGSEFGDRLETNRGFAQRMLADLGFSTCPTAEFVSAADALKDLRRQPRRCVFKRCASEGDTFVGALADGRDVAAFLMVSPPASGDRFVLMDHVGGIEMGIGAYFNGQRFLWPACLDWEHKRFFPGDMGELTGEMGTVATFEGAERLFEATLKLLEPQLRDARHVGYVNLNMIFNQDGLWPLEFTCRFGYPGFAALEVLQDLRWSDLFRLMLARDSVGFPVTPGFSLAVVLSTPPFPWSREQLETPVGLPVVIGELTAGQLHWAEVGLVDGNLVTSGLYGWTMVATGTGSTILAAKQQAYSAAAQVTTPNLRYRLDIGDRLISGDLDRIASLGWLNSVPSRRMASQIVR